MKVKLIFMLLITACLGSFAQSKDEEYTLSGTIVDSSDNKGLGFATVSLKNEKNAALRALATGADGAFSFRKLSPGKYILTVVSVGYGSQAISIPFTKTTDLGKIIMRRSATVLKDISVSAEMPLIRQEIDRISYNLEADPESKGSNVLSMMRKVPFLSVDAEDNVLFKGKDDFKVLINGRSSAMVERNLKEILKSMPASTIKSIEVITNSSSKYTSEGLAGIINIITYKPVAGYKGTVNISERFPVGGPGLGSSFTLKRGKFGISAFGGSTISKSPQTRSNINRISTIDDNTNLLQNGLKSTDGYSGYLGSEISYEINDLNLIAIQFNANGSSASNKVRQYSEIFDQTGLLQNFDIDNDNEVKGSGRDAAINFQHGFKSNKNKLLTFSYQYSAYKNDFQSLQNVVNHLNYPAEDFRQDNLGKFREHTLQADYVQLLGKVLVEAGIKGIMRQNNSRFMYQPLVSGDNQPDLSTKNIFTNNLFTNNQDIFGVYNSYQFAIKKLEVKAGFRMEQTIIDADFISDGTNVSKNYLSLLPSVSVNRKINSVNAFNFGYGQRIKRPGINRLNPFVDRSNPQFESSGNPNLRQAKIHQFQLGYSRTKKSTINWGIDYSFADDIPLQVSRYDPQTGVTFTTYENTASASGLSSSLYINYPLSKRFRLTLNSNAGYNWLKGMNNNVPVSIDIFTYNASSSAKYSFNNGWRVNAGVNIISKNITSLQGRSNALVSSSLGVNKDIVKSKLTFSATASNPFTKYRSNEVTTTAYNFYQTSFSQDYFRGFNMSLNYTFGKLKESLKKTKRSIKNDDLAN